MNRSTVFLFGSVMLAAVSVASYLLIGGDSPPPATVLLREGPPKLRVKPSSGQPLQLDAQSSMPPTLAEGKGSAAPSIDPAPLVSGDALAAGTMGARAAINPDNLRSSTRLSAVAKAQRGTVAATRVTASITADSLPMEFLAEPVIVTQSGGMHEVQVPRGLQVPASLVGIDRDRAQTAGQEELRRQIKDQFLGAITASADITSGDAIVEAAAWTAAQTWSDARYRTLFGEAAYQQQKLKGAKLSLGLSE